MIKNLCHCPTLVETDTLHLTLWLKIRIINSVILYDLGGLGLLRLKKNTDDRNINLAFRENGLPIFSSLHLHNLVLTFSLTHMVMMQLSPSSRSYFSTAFIFVNWFYLAVCTCPMLCAVIMFYNDTSEAFTIVQLLNI